MQRPIALSTLSTLAALLLTFSGAGPTPGAAQEPEAQEGDLERPPLTQYREQRAAELMAGIEGAWRLTRFLHATNPLSADQIVIGFAIFHSGFGTIIIHAVDYPENALEPEQMYQALAFQYRFDETLRMQAATVLGHGSFEGEIQVEPTLAPREFNVELLGDTMILTRPDGSRLQFLRSVNPAFPEKTQLLIQQHRGRSVQPVDRDN